ncbi:6181_t:CDS:2, partial [Scutellospora calospora]
MLKIKAAQSERNRLSMLLAEYTNDVAESQSIRAIKSRKDLLWSLATKLWDAFNYPDPKTHPLFKGVPELNKEGIANILSFYETGKSRFQEILAQDVYKTEPRITTGCRGCNIKSYTYAQLTEKKKKMNNQVDDHPSQTSTIQQMEKAILDQLFESEELLKTTISDILLQLNAISPDWMTERIK